MSSPVEFEWAVGAAVGSLPPVADPASELGVDIADILDITREFRLAGGYENLGMAYLRRLSTPRGSLFYDLDYGFDLRDMLNAGLGEAELRSLDGQIEAELLKDERSQQVSVRTTFNYGTSTLRVRITAETAEGPYSLVLEVSALTVALLAAGLGTPAF
jgi:hypothetical protein